MARVSGTKRIAQQFKTAPGTVLFIGDSITAQAEDFLVQVVPNCNGVNVQSGLSFPLALAGCWSAPPTLTLTGYSSIATCRRATFLGGTTSADSALNNRIIADNFGFRVFGTNTASTSSQEKLFGSNWLNEALQLGAIRVSVPILLEPTGVTTSDIRLRILNTAGAVIASSAYFSTFAATDTLSWVSVDIPQGTTFAANGGSWCFSYRPSTVTVNNKTLTVIGRQAITRVTPIASGAVICNAGVGGTTAAQWAAYDPILYSFFGSFDPSFVFFALGQNGTSSASQHQTDITACVQKMVTAKPSVKVVLWSTHATTAGNGAGFAEQAHVTGNENAAIANNWLHLNVQEAMPKYEFLNQSLSNNWSSIATGKRIPPFSLVRYPNNASTIYVSRTSHEKIATTPDVDTTNWAGPLTIAGTEVSDSPLFGKTNQIISDGTHLSHMGNFVMTQALSGLISEAAALSDGTDILDLIDAVEAIQEQMTPTGARTRTFNVQQVTVGTPLEGVRIRVTKGSESYVLVTNSSGTVVAGLDDGTYSVSITLPGYTFAPTTLVISADGSATYDLTPVSITPSNPSQTTGYWTVYNLSGVIQPNAQVELRTANAPTSSTGLVLEDSVRTATADSNGLVQFTNLFPGVSYIANRAGSTRQYTITVPANAGASVALGSIVG